MALGSGKSTVISFFVYLVVIVGGAVIMMFMEREGMSKAANKDGQLPGNKSSLQTNTRNATMHAKQYLENHGSLSWTHKDVEKLLKEIKSFEKKKTKSADQADHKTWRKELSFQTFANWEYFVLNTVSTIGYGDITPISAGGKILAILVAVIGIPVNMYFFASIAVLLTKGVACLKNLAASRCRKKEPCKPDMICFFFCIILLLLYVGAGGIAVGLSEGWRWHDGLYWSFMSSTTVGFGDLIPKHKAKFTFAYLGIIFIMMPVYAINQALTDDEETVKEDRLMVKPEDV